jgi:hypothetical protein
MYINATEPISHQSVCLYLYVARQQLGRKLIAATNTDATIDELFVASLSMWSVSYQRKVAEYFFPELLVLI